MYCQGMGYCRAASADPGTGAQCVRCCRWSSSFSKPMQVRQDSRQQCGCFESCRSKFDQFENDFNLLPRWLHDKTCKKLECRPVSTGLRLGSALHAGFWGSRKRLTVGTGSHPTLPKTNTSKFAKNEHKRTGGQAVAADGCMQHAVREVLHPPAHADTDLCLGSRRWQRSCVSRSAQLPTCAREQGMPCCA